MCSLSSILRMVEALTDLNLPKVRMKLTENGSINIVNGALVAPILWVCEGMYKYLCEYIYTNIHRHLNIQRDTYTQI